MIIRDVNTLAKVIGENSKAAILFDDLDAAQEVLGALTTTEQVVCAGIFYKNGNIFAKYLREGTKEDVLPKRVGRKGHQFVDDDIITFQDVTFENDVIGTIFIRSDTRMLKTRLKEYVKVVVIVLLLSSLVAYFLGIFLQRIFTKPIYFLLETTKKISREKDYSIRAEMSQR